MYKLFSHIIPVLGYKKGLLCDLYRERIYSLPFDFISLIAKSSTIEISNLVNVYGMENEETIKEYLRFLIQRELVHDTNNKITKNFPPLSLEWDSPSLITNAIIEINNKTTIPTIQNTLNELQLMRCKALGLVLHQTSLEFTFPLISFIDNHYNFIIELSLEHTFNDSEEFIIKKTSQLNKVVRVITHGCGYEKKISSNKFSHLSFHWTNISHPEASCAIISENPFRINMQYFCEAQNYNSCLNRRICINSRGDVKVCLKSGWHYGNIKNTSLKEIIGKPELTKYWTLNKNKIDVCKDCEFRYVCKDCRVFIKDPENIYSQPAKCTYNPYIAKWQGEEGYIPVEECGTYTRKTGFVPNKERIAELNREIWGE